MAANEKGFYRRFVPVRSRQVSLRPFERLTRDVVEKRLRLVVEIFRVLVVLFVNVTKLFPPLLRLPATAFALCTLLGLHWRGTQ